MKIFFIWVLASTLLISCDSPRNHRVYEVTGEGDTKAVGILSLSKAGIFIEAKWVKGPFGTSTKSSEILVVVKDIDGNRVSLGDELGFYAWMPSMGHPMPDAGYFEEISEGIYLNTTIKFNMGGEWEMFLQTYDADYNIKDRVKWLEVL